MLDFLQIILAFIVTIGLLVTVHEFGHFWVARRLGVKILRFSVGFGRPIWSRRLGADQTEFMIAVLPLGGYVKMLGEGDDEEDISEADLPRAFNRKPLWARSLIVAAGPLANFLFAIFAYALMFMTGVPGLKPIIGEVEPGSLAANAGLTPGQEIVAVEDKPVQRWESVLQAVLQTRLDQETISLTLRDEDGYSQTHELNLASVSVDDFSQGGFLNEIGVKRGLPTWPPVLGEIVADTPAARAGLQVGDEIVALDDRPVSDWEDVVNYISQRAGQSVDMVVTHDGERREITLTPEAGEEGQGRIGVRVKRPDSWPPERYWGVEQHGPLTALWLGAVKTWDMTLMSLRILGKMLVLEVSTENLSGPISIAQFAGVTMSLGLATFLSFLALVSLSLGLVNLLPIPVLDGGHLLLNLLEWIKGKPLSDRAVGLMQRVGITLLLMLMGLAIFNDLNRLLG